MNTHLKIVKDITRSIKINLVFLVSTFILFGSIPVVFAWSAPSARPPLGNTPSPLTVSGTSQTKEGKLGVLGLGVFGQTVMNKSGSTYSLTAFSRPSLTLGVNGKVGAEEYCDKDGLNCVTTASLLGGAAVTSPTPTTGSKRKQVRIGPAGCNHILTTSATCKTIGVEACTGDGCASQYLNCKGVKGNHRYDTCPTVPVNLYID